MLLRTHVYDVYMFTHVYHTTTIQTFNCLLQSVASCRLFAKIYMILQLQKECKHRQAGSGKSTWSYIDFGVAYVNVATHVV